MRLKCVVCSRPFTSKRHSRDVDRILCNIDTTFCNSVVPNPSADLSGQFQFCFSCRSAYLKPVHERRAKIAQLEARIKQKVSVLKGLLLQNPTECPRKPIGLSEPRILASKFPARRLISAKVFVSDSINDVDDSAGNAEFTDETHIQSVSSLDQVKKSTSENPPLSTESEVEKIIEYTDAAENDTSSISDRGVEQTGEVLVSEAVSSSPSKPPADCLTYHGIPYEQLPYGEGYKCRACNRSKIRLTLPSVTGHIRRAHLGKTAANRKSYMVDDKGTQRICYLGKYFCHKLQDDSFKCGSCDYPAKRKLLSILGHLRMRHAGVAERRRRLVEVSPGKFEYYGLTAERRKDGSFLCGSCPFTTKAIKNIYRHLREKLTKGTPRICEICGKVFHSDRDLYSHRRTHPTGIDQKCTQCGKSFDTKSKLYDHRVKIHGRRKKHAKPSKSYVCEFCGKEYKSKSCFDSHMNVYHSSNPKTFECKVCGKSYASGIARNVHMNSHTGKKDYSCDVCGLKFTQAYSVIRHKNVAHKES